MADRVSPTIERIGDSPVMRLRWELRQGDSAEPARFGWMHEKSVQVEVSLGVTVCIQGSCDGERYHDLGSELRFTFPDLRPLHLSPVFIQPRVEGQDRDAVVTVVLTGRLT